MRLTFARGIAAAAGVADHGGRGAEVHVLNWNDDTVDDHAGWFCVRTDPFPCPANGCEFVADFMTAAHLVLVWEDATIRTCSGTRSLMSATRRSSVRERLSGPSASSYVGSRGPARPRSSWPITSAVA